ncbi:MAG TPA: hypothetical protein VI584_04040, partial [Nitrospiria bacterium]|nr:hypothetical protein [Nitrospiria bacterium]
GKDSKERRTPFEMIAPKEGLYNQKREASVNVKKQNGSNNKEEKYGRLLTQVDPLAYVTSIRIVQFICEVGMEQGENRKQKEIDEKKRDPNGAPTESGFTIRK